MSSKVLHMCNAKVNIPSCSASGYLFSVGLPISAKPTTVDTDIVSIFSGPTLTQFDYLSRSDIFGAIRGTRKR